MSEHLINGEFQSDKYPTCPAGKVPLSTKDPMAQDLLWTYAQRRREVDPEFSDYLEAALRLPPALHNLNTALLRMAHDPEHPGHADRTEGQQRNRVVEVLAVRSSGYGPTTGVWERAPD